MHEMCDAMMFPCGLSNMKSEVLAELGTSLHWRYGRS